MKLFIHPPTRSLKAASCALLMVLSFYPHASNASGYLGGRYWDNCITADDKNGLGKYSYCNSGSDYRLQYQSGLYVFGTCGGQWWRNPFVAESDAQLFHNRVCGTASRPSGSNIYDLMRDIFTKQYQYY